MLFIVRQGGPSKSVQHLHIQKRLLLSVFSSVSQKGAQRKKAVVHEAYSYNYNLSTKLVSSNI